MRYHYEICCDEYVTGSGFSTTGSVVDTFDSDEIITDTASVISALDHLETDNSTDYLYTLRCYDNDENEIHIDADEVWESER